MRSRVLVAIAAGARPPGELQALGETAELRCVSRPEEFRLARADADILLVWDLATTLLRDCGPGGLRWIHTNSIGVNAVATPEVAASGVAVTNTRGLFERPMAEYVLGSVLAHTKRLRRTIENQRREAWEQLPSMLLDGRRAVVVGAGGVGRAIADLLGAVGMTVALVGRTRRQAAQDRAWPVHGVDELPSLLEAADDVILAAPLTEATRGMIGAEQFARMREGVHIVNVGRGPLIVEADLIAALRAGKVGGAALDVFDAEPLGPGHPFWSMEQVLVSAHQSASYEGWRRLAVEMFAGNLERWRTGSPLENRVDLDAFLLRT